VIAFTVIDGDVENVQEVDGPDGIYELLTRANGLMKDLSAFGHDVRFEVFDHERPAAATTKS